MKNVIIISNIEYRKPIKLKKVMKMIISKNGININNKNKIFKFLS